MSVKAKIIFFSSDFTGELKSGHIKDGNIIISEGKEKKEYIVDKAQPFNIKYRKFGKPEVTYLCNWGSLLPLQFKPMEIEDNGVKTIKLVPLDLEEYKTRIKPDMLAETGDMRFLKHMKKYSEDKKFSGEGLSMILKIIFGVIVVILIFTFVLPMFNIKLF